MKRSWPAFAILVALVSGFVFFGRASAQYEPQAQYNNNGVLYGPGWQVMKAEWGSGNRWMDVTYQVRILLSGNGMVRVNNLKLRC